MHMSVDDARLQCDAKLKQRPPNTHRSPPQCADNISVKKAQRSLPPSSPPSDADIYITNIVQLHTKTLNLIDKLIRIELSSDVKHKTKSLYAQRQPNKKCETLQTLVSLTANQVLLPGCSFGVMGRVCTQPCAKQMCRHTCDSYPSSHAQT
jgi:hypothetical protein